MIENLICAMVVMFGFCMMLQAVCAIIMMIFEIIDSFKTKKD